MKKFIFFIIALVIVFGFSWLPDRAVFSLLPLSASAHSGDILYALPDSYDPAYEIIAYDETQTELPVATISAKHSASSLYVAFDVTQSWLHIEIFVDTDHSGTLTSDDWSFRIRADTQLEQCCWNGTAWNAPSVDPYTSFTTDGWEAVSVGGAGAEFKFALDTPSSRLGEISIGDTIGVVFCVLTDTPQGVWPTGAYPADDPTAWGDLAIVTEVGPETQVAISVSPIGVDFGTILPGRDVTGSDLAITNTGNVAVTVTTEIIEDIEFYGKYLKFNNDDASDWTATISTDGNPTTVTTKLEGVPSYLEPGSYTCTIIFWAEEV